RSGTGLGWVTAFYTQTQTELRELTRLNRGGRGGREGKAERNFLSAFPCILHPPWAHQLGLELIPHLPDRENMLRIGGVTLQLASQLRNVRIDRPAHDRSAIAPHRAEQLVPADDTPLPTQERDEQIELLRRQLD